MKDLFEGLFIKLKYEDEVKRFQKWNLSVTSNHNNNKTYTATTKMLERQNCGPFIIHQEDKSLWNRTNTSNRIDRISILRDYQRNSLRKQQRRQSNAIDGVITLVDLDLFHETLTTQP